MPQARIAVKVQPRARRNEVLGYQGEVLRLRVTAAPERGKANEAVIRLIAKTLGVPPSAVSVAKGAASRQKVLLIDGLDGGEARRRLELAGDDGSDHL